MLPFHSRLFIALAIYTATHAASATTLLVKYSSPGYFIAEASISTSCVLDDSGMLTIKKSLNTMSSKTVTSTQISLANIRKMIDEAATGNLKKPEVMMQDAPGKTYYAIQKKADGTLKKILLFIDTGMPDNNTYINSPAAFSLKNFTDAVCD